MTTKMIATKFTSTTTVTTITEAIMPTMKTAMTSIIMVRKPIITKTRILLVLNKEKRNKLATIMFLATMMTTIVTITHNCNNDFQSL